MDGNTKNYLPQIGIKTKKVKENKVKLVSLSSTNAVVAKTLMNVPGNI